MFKIKLKLNCVHTRVNVGGVVWKMVVEGRGGGVLLWFCHGNGNHLFITSQSCVQLLKLFGENEVSVGKAVGFVLFEIIL